MMLTLDSTTLFFYSHIISNNNNLVPPSKKRKAELDPISTWIDNVKPHAPLPSRAASSTSKTTLRSASFYPPPSLTASSTRSSHSTLTNTICITQNALLPTTAIKKEPKEVSIEVADKGVFSDYNETEGQEREKALASGTKHGVHASSLVSHIHIFWSILALPLFTRTSSLRTHQSLWPLHPNPQGRSQNLAFLMGSSMGSFTALLFLPLLHILLIKETPGIVWPLFYATRFVLSSGIQVTSTLRLALRVLSIRMYIHALLHNDTLTRLPGNSMTG